MTIQPDLVSSWAVALENPNMPLYRLLSDVIGRTVEAGILGPGDQLPTQRQLAGVLGIALTTVTRAYADAERRGVLRGEVGRGTFVRAPASGQGGVPMVDLRTNILLPLPHAPRLLDEMARTISDLDASVYFGYGPNRGNTSHREAAAQFLQTQGINADPAQVLLTCGGQHAMAVIFATITEPGDTVLAESHTFAGMKSLARLLRLRLRGVPMDSEGVTPDAFRAACAGGAKAFYTMPTLQNPLSCTMSVARRMDIAGIAAAHSVTIVEDDVYGFLHPGLPPLTTFAENGCYLTSASKCLVPSMRVGMLVAPRSLVDRLEAAISATANLVSAILAEVFTIWQRNGTVAEVIAWKRAETRRRQALAVKVLEGAGADYITAPQSPHGWLRLTEPWTSHDFVRQAEARGVRVTAAEDFAVSREAAETAVRICVGPAPNTPLLSRGIEIIEEMRRGGPKTEEGVM
jgi:DNA-binding transcriptional MocR family regulator